MKRKKWAGLMSLCLAVVLCFSIVPVGAAVLAPVESRNRTYEQRSYSPEKIHSYLYENEKNGLTRVEYIEKPEQIVVEEYNSAFQLVSQRSLTLELPIWGGFFAGERYNYFIEGQENPQESDQQEVIRVIKYSKDWQRLDQTVIRGFDTCIPFDAGVVRCAESGDMLYVFTCHEKYQDKNGIHHQNNVFFSIQQSNMELTYDNCTGASGHSFNQFVLVDSQNNIVRLDAKDRDSDSYVFTFYMTLGKAGLSDPESHGLEQQAAGSFQENTYRGNSSGVCAGGFVETSLGYLTAYAYRPNGSGNYKNLYLAFTDKSAILPSDQGSLFYGKGTTIRQFTDLDMSGYDDGYTAVSTPKLTALDRDHGYLMWNNQLGIQNGDSLYYTIYNADGTINAIQSAQGYLSDCQPIVYNGKVTWYATGEGAYAAQASVPTFYQLDASGVTAAKASQLELPSAWAQGYVTEAMAENLVPASLQSKYTQPATRAEFCALAVQLYETVTGNAVSGRETFGDTNDVNVEKAAYLGVISGVGGGRADPNGKITREQAAVMLASLAKACGKPLPELPHSFSDRNISGWADGAIGQVQNAGIMSGTGTDTFSPQAQYTREQSITTMLSMFRYVK